MAELIRIGYSHASLIGCLRPDVAYPDRKVRRGNRVVTTITAEPCDCADEHVEVFVRKVESDG
jgi:hypothetical protein